jgi:hypothetical protein
MAHYKVVKREIRAEFDALEREFYAESASVRTGSQALKTEFVTSCWARASLATERWIEKLEKRSYGFSHAGYAAMWARFNAEASLAF